MRDDPNIETRVASLEKELASLRQGLEEQRIADRIARGLEQINRGETVPAFEAMETIRKKYNIQAT